MKIKTFNNYLDYINSDENNWSYVELKDFEDAEDKSDVYHKNEDEYFGFIVDDEPDYNAKTAQERADDQREIYRTLK